MLAFKATCVKSKVFLRLEDVRPTKMKRYKSKCRKIKKAEMRSRRTCFLVNQRRQNCAEEQMTSFRSWICRKVNFRRTMNNRRCFSSNCDKMSKKQGVVFQREGMVTKREDEVRTAECRLGKQHQKFEEKSSGCLNYCPRSQKESTQECVEGAVKRGSRSRRSHAQQVWSFVSQLFSNSMLREASLGDRRNNGAGSTALVSEPSLQSHPRNMQDRYHQGLVKQVSGKAQHGLRVRAQEQDRRQNGNHTKSLGTKWEKYDVFRGSGASPQIDELLESVHMPSDQCRTLNNVAHIWRRCP